MYGQTLLMLIVFVPIIGAFLLPLAGNIKPRLRNALALIFVLVPFLLLTSAVPCANTEAAYYFNYELPLGLNFGLYADGLAVFCALTSALLGIIIIIYSYGYMAHYENQNEFYLEVVLFIGAMMGITLTTSLVFLYVFWEISAICCWRLIGFYREKEYVRRANKAFLITGGGALIMLMGFILVYRQYGTTDLMLLKGREISNAAVSLMLIGICSKSATVPLHSWMPDAGVAPTPVTALLHAAVLVKIGVYAYVRLFVVNMSISEFWETAVPVIAAVSALVSAGAAIAENDIKRIIAYSTVSQIAFIFLGISAGSRLALAGGILYILMHGISKAGLFMCAGVVEHNCHTKDITKLGGLIKTMPVTAVSFLLCGFSIMGVPPFGGFFSKYMVVNGAIFADKPGIAVAFLIGAVMTVIYILRAFVKVFLGDKKLDEKEGTPAMLCSAAVLAGLSVLSGLLINYPAGFVNDMLQQMAVMAK